jgi:hypothetical protein
MPGLAPDHDSDFETRQATVAQKMRPRSFTVAAGGLPTSISFKNPLGKPHSGVSSVFVHHTRTKSLPPPTHRFSGPSTGDNLQRRGELAISAGPQPSLQTMHEENELEAVVTMPPAKESPHAPPHDERSAPEGHAPSTTSSLAENLEPEFQPHAMPTGAVVKNIESVDGEQLEDSRPCGCVEVIEGQGMYERPRLLSLSTQRPKRKKSGNTIRRQHESISQPAAADSTADKDASHDCLDHGVSSTPLRNHSLGASSAAAGESQLQHSQAIPPASTNEVAHPAEGIQRGLSNATGHSSQYSDSAGAPASVSDDSDYSHPSRTPPQMKSLFGAGQSRPGQVDSFPGAERAAVQRVAAPSTPLESFFPRSRRSGSINSARERRPLTAGSAASSVSHKLKGFISRHHGETDSLPPIRLRSSSDVSRRSSSYEPNDDKSGLDKLIRSNETIRYTLTPRNMREMEARKIIISYENYVRTDSRIRPRARLGGTQLWQNQSQ